MGGTTHLKFIEGGGGYNFSWEIFNLEEGEEYLIFELHIIKIEIFFTPFNKHTFSCIFY